MNPIKALIQRLPGGRALTERLSYKRRQKKLEKIGDAEDRFTHIYDQNKWKDAESRSGAGSSLETTAATRAALPGLFEEFGVKRFLDAPCGDYNWFRLVERSHDLHYIGGDIVKALVDSNISAYGDEKTEFAHLDITSDPLPDADLWLCRDCLIHLSFEDVERAVQNFLASEIPYWLVTTHTNVNRNIDIPTGHCRMINLAKEPFNFGEPLRYVEDTDHDGTGKSLGLWERETLRATLKARE